MEKFFVVVAGNIGSGKSTLVRKLSQKLGWQAIYEPEVENPYLEDFYLDMARWALPSQTFFLGRRLGQYQTVKESKVSVLQDRCIYEDAEVFARNLFDQGTLSARDWENYFSLYQGIVQELIRPDLLIYLKADLGTLRIRIANRGRDYEREIPPAYLQGLQSLYERWITGYRISPVLTVPADWLDFVKEEKHLDLIVQKMTEKLSGHETLNFTESPKG